MTNKDDYFNPNLQVTLTPLPDAVLKAKRLGLAGYGIFEILKSKNTIDLQYLTHCDFWDFHTIQEERSNVLLIIYALLFGYNRAFDVQGDEVDSFADIILKAANNKNSAYIHNHLSRLGYFESSNYNNSINKI